MASLKGKLNPAYKHGFATKGKRPTIYYKWQRMIARCHHPSQKDYAAYGAQGITVCKRWRFGEDGVSGFECWLLDMGAPPNKAASIDRLDGTKGYSPDNCRWATRATQSRNTRANRLITYEGVTRTVAEWAEVRDIKYMTLYYRLFHYAWDTKRALGY